jgi:AbrB family looped-hinge helix DNA binding protein
LPRITQKGQVTIPKQIRDMLDIKPNDIGEFTVKEGVVLFTVQKGTILDSHRITGFKEIDHEKQRELMEKEIALKIAGEIN